MPDSEFEIIDSHVHYWDPMMTPRTLSRWVKLLGSGRFLDWSIGKLARRSILNHIGKPSIYRQSYLPADHFLHDNNLRAASAIHVEADWKDKALLAEANETKWLDKLIPKPVGIVGKVSLGSRCFEDLIEQHKLYSRSFCGVRQMFANHPSPSVHDFFPTERGILNPSCEEHFELLGNLNLPFDVFIYSHQLPDLVTISQSFQATTFVLNHIGTPVGLMGPFADVGQNKKERNRIFLDWKTNMETLARSKNVFVKISGLFMPCIGWAIPEPRAGELTKSVLPILEFIVELFGSKRCLFGSNFPVDIATLPSEIILQVYKNCFSCFSSQEQKDILGGTARQIYDLEARH